MTKEYIALKMEKKEYERLKEFFDSFYDGEGEIDYDAFCDYCVGENTDDLFNNWKELFYDLIQT